MLNLKEIQRLLKQRMNYGLQDENESDPVITGEKFLQSPQPPVQVNEEFKQSLTKLQSSLEIFQEKQKILHGNKVENLEDAISSRNNQRQMLLEDIKVFLKASGGGIYEEKLTEVKQLMEAVAVLPGAKVARTPKKRGEHGHGKSSRRI